MGKLAQKTDINIEDLVNRITNEVIRHLGERPLHNSCCVSSAVISAQKERQAVQR